MQYVAMPNYFYYWVSQDQVYIEPSTEMKQKKNKKKKKKKKKV